MQGDDDDSSSPLCHDKCGHPRSSSTGRESVRFCGDDIVFFHHFVIAYTLFVRRQEARPLALRSSTTAQEFADRQAAASRSIDFTKLPTFDLTTV
jgi:hypothetical protein